MQLLSSMMVAAISRLSNLRTGNGDMAVGSKLGKH
jgi:hypothetical protein